MQITTKHVLIGLGITAVVAGGGYAIWKMTRPEAPTIPLPPGRLPPPPQGPGGGPGEIGMRAPTWSVDASVMAVNIIADEYEKRGRPPYDPQMVIEIAFVAASEIWPQWSWPMNVNQSNLFLQSNDPGAIVWSNLIALTQDQLGYRPIT